MQNGDHLCQWKKLLVEDPDNATPLMHIPTIPVENAKFVPQKQLTGKIE